MRSERVGARIFLIAALLGAACEEKAGGGASPERFAGVRKAAIKPATPTTFCDRSFPASGEGSRRYVAPPLRPLGEGGEENEPAVGWTWVNLWATWCTPCVEEMGLLSRWRDALDREGTPVNFRLLSIDGSEKAKELEAWRRRTLPGSIQWLRSEEDFGPFLDGLGVERNAAIPIHVLVDAAKNVRCVRVGAVHEQDYGAIRALLGEKRVRGPVEGEL